MDVVIDETSVPFGGCGEFVTNLRGKLCSRGVQIALLLDVGTTRCRGFYPRHTQNKKYDGFTRQGTCKVQYLLEKFVEPHVGFGKLWSIKPHITCDNFFVNMPLCYWIGQMQYGLTATLAKNYLPPKIPSKYFHKLETSGT